MPAYPHPASIPHTSSAPSAQPWDHSSAHTGGNRLRDMKGSGRVRVCLYPRNTIVIMFRSGILRSWVESGILVGRVGRVSGSPGTRTVSAPDIVRTRADITGRTGTMPVITLVKVGSEQRMCVLKKIKINMKDFFLQWKPENSLIERRHYNIQENIKRILFCYNANRFNQ